jgi:hypothetical protein
MTKERRVKIMKLIHPIQWRKTKRAITAPWPDLPHLERTPT